MSAEEQAEILAAQIEDHVETALIAVFGQMHNGGIGNQTTVGAVPPEDVGDGGVIELHEGLAVGGLIASGDEGIERHRVVIREGDLFFDEAAEDADLLGRKGGWDGGGGGFCGHGEGLLNGGQEGEFLRKCRSGACWVQIF